MSTVRQEDGRLENPEGQDLIHLTTLGRTETTRLEDFAGLIISVPPRRE